MGKSGRGSFAIGPTRRRLGIGPGDLPYALVTIAGLEFELVAWT